MNVNSLLRLGLTAVLMFLDLMLCQHAAWHIICQLAACGRHLVVAERHTILLLQQSCEMVRCVDTD
jgi:hypothetical protein